MRKGRFEGKDDVLQERTVSSFFAKNRKWAAKAPESFASVSTINFDTTFWFGFDTGVLSARGA
jgi:hypothetical protein